MELGLQQRQELNLLMTAELRQAIELLQYSTYELEQYIREQELENPLIQLKEKEGKPAYEERLHRRSFTYGDSELPLDAVQCAEENKREELLKQAKFMYPDAPTQSLLKYLIYNLDDNGFLQLNDRFSKNDLPFNEGQIETGIHLLQELGPIGMGARDLKECLLLQIMYNYPENKLAARLVENHLTLVADRKWNEIASRMGITMAEVKTLFDFIQTLNPRPCFFMSDDSTKYLTPDIIVDRNGNGFTFHLNDGYLPGIHMNKNYSQYLTNKSDASKFVQSQYKNFQWLLNSIEQRRNTIIKIVSVLLEKQEQFFKNGFDSIKPLTLKEVADEIGMHESTVSRATSNKVVQTSFGSFELRLLFTSKLETSDGTTVSQTKVKQLLRDIIAKENKFKPYSDQKIAEYFKIEKGIEISRRTISKYREELRIPSSSRRKDIQI
ncbi:RNA polymerase factor sigma-54 [Sporosarcina gallistercoris]|uniref:RNA polymerase factor sigma-54 n=1 Tax=Sporosarcina gallistercoris TaxID=2762245 RepID=A0ABR8PLM3_9BACL|nr:RNA polymerase factor sigma-54 [Sporosarcina gallistercoris]MBD7909061.1 RNA polymerase factor sigma-54 [Sporosarcina gallistercoris]